MSDDEAKKAVGAEGGSIDPTSKQQQPKKAVKSEPYEGNIRHTAVSPRQRQSMLESCEVTEARRNARAPRVYSVGQNFKTWLS